MLVLVLKEQRVLSIGREIKIAANNWAFVRTIGRMQIENKQGIIS